MEFFPSVTLLTYLKEVQSPLPELLVKNIIFQILQALNHLHAMNICHRDLNLENVLISISKTDIKLIDFGISKQLSRDKMHMFSPVGNLNNRAPEFNDIGCYSLSSDLWQIGLIFLQILRKETISTKKAIKYMEEGSLKNEENIGDVGKKLLESMLEKNPTKRITCPDALNHEWIRNMMI